MTLDLTDDEKVALVRLFRHAIDDGPFPHAPRARSAVSDPGQAGPSCATTRVVAAAQIRYDATPRDRPARATMNSQPRAPMTLPAMPLGHAGVRAEFCDGEPKLIQLRP
jgi:hypothetical protein